MCQQVSKNMFKKIWPTAVFEPATCGLANRGATPHMYYSSGQRFCASWVKSGKGKKTATTELKTFLTKVFSTENK